MAFALWPPLAYSNLIPRREGPHTAAPRPSSRSHCHGPAQLPGQSRGFPRLLSAKGYSLQLRVPCPRAEVSARPRAKPRGEMTNTNELALTALMRTTPPELPTGPPAWYERLLVGLSHLGCIRLLPIPQGPQGAGPTAHESWSCGPFQLRSAGRLPPSVV